MSGFQIPAGALHEPEDRHGRVLTCSSCHTAVRVYEARQGARTDSDHRWLNPDTYRCGDCVEAGSADQRGVELAAAIERERARATQTGRGIPYRPEAV